MNSTQTRLYTRLRMTHRNQREALSVREVHKKAHLFSTYRRDYARLDSPAQRATMLRQLAQNALRLKQAQVHRRTHLLTQQQQELITFKNRADGAVESSLPGAAGGGRVWLSRLV